MLHRQQENLFVSAAATKLRTIRVLFPPDPAQERSIGGTKRDQITAAAMVWAEHQPLRPQLSESLLDVVPAQPWAIPPDGDDFVIAKLRDPFHCVFKPGRESPPLLSMNLPPCPRRI